jgi:hypothetical protein
MDLASFLDKRVDSALKEVKLIADIVDYSKIEDDEFIQAPELGFYLESIGGEKITGYRVYVRHYRQYFPAKSELKGFLNKIDKVQDAFDFLGEPIRSIRSLNIPSLPPTLPGIEFSFEDKIVSIYHDKDEIYYMNVKHRR